MKRVKCYGRAKVNTVDSSFRNKFFGPYDSKNSGEGNNFQEFLQKGSRSFSSFASSSNYTNMDSRELFASDSNSSDENFPNYLSLKAEKTRRKKISYDESIYSWTLPSQSSFDLQLASTSKAKKTLKKHSGIPKSRVKQRISKQFKPPAKMKASHSSCKDTGMSYMKNISKNPKRMKSYKTSTLKRNPKRNQLHSLNKHSSIPVRPSCSDFCENPSFVMNTGVKKTNKKGSGKKKQLINKDCDVSTSNFSTNMISSFESKGDSFWVAIQPRWSSIYKYSLEIEKPSKRREKANPVFCEQPLNENASYIDHISKENEQLSSKRGISGGIPFQFVGSNRCEHLAVEKYTSIDEVNVSRGSNLPKHGSNLNVNSAETIDGILTDARDISENVAACKSGQILPEMIDREILQISDSVASNVSNFCEIPYEQIVVGAIADVNEDENPTRIEGKSVETYDETESKKSSKEFMSPKHSYFTARETSSGNKNIFEINNEKEYFSENADQLREYAPVILSKKNKDFYSSTPLESRITRAPEAKIFPSIREFSPILHKNNLISSTPISSQAVRVRQNQICNVSRISYLGRRCSSLHDINNDSSVKLQKYPSTKINSSVLLRKEKNTVSFINCTSHSQISRHSTRSWLSNSRREHSALGRSQCFNKSYSFSTMESFSSIALKRSEDDFEATLSKLLKFCCQTRIIPFKELYEWSHTTVRKIGEGTYAEVFSLVQNKISSVVKIIPFSKDSEDHSMQNIKSVLSEVTVSLCLSELRSNKTHKTKNFNKLKSAHLVRGCYPDQMLVAWDKFSVAKSTYNSRPDIYNEEQLFVIIELEYGGKDMTCFVLRNAAEGESVLKQITISLAIAEEVNLFEHRDLHLGNILVQRNTSKTISYVLGGKAFSIPNHGLVVTIIDFTLSRVLHEGCIFYKDLADDSLFDQTGDIQFEIYKKTKLHLKNKWDKCLLYSNVLWLTFLCVKLLEYKYSRPSSKKHEEGLKSIRIFQNNLKNCTNAFECLDFCNIPPSFHKIEQCSAKKMAIKAKLVDRSSLQKSTSCRTSNIH